MPIKIFGLDFINGIRVTVFLLPFIGLLVLVFFVTMLVTRRRTLKDKVWLDAHTKSVIHDLETQVELWKEKARNERRRSNGLIKELYGIILTKMENKS